MQRSMLWRIVVAVAFVIAPLAVLTSPPGVSHAQNAAPDPATVDDEIIVLEYNGGIRIDDPYTAPGNAPATWTSGADIGWNAIAAGDFNGDGDDEIVAIKGATLKVFDPFGPSGSVPATLDKTLPGSLAFHLIATGDFDRDGRDEIAFTRTSSSTVFSEELWVYHGNASGTAWTESHKEDFGTSWRAMSTGDMNNDGYADLVLVRAEGALGRTKVYSGNLWTVLAERPDNFPWLTVNLGNISSSYSGDEMALTRQDVGSSLPSLILWRLSGSSLVDLVAGSIHNPPFTSLSLGDLNGDGDDEVVMLRNPQQNNVFALVVKNPTGATMAQNLESSLNYPTIWQQVRTGDTDADGKAEIVVLRSGAYRVFSNPDLNNNYTDTFGSYRVPISSNYDRSTLALANVDGSGIVLGPMLSLNPTSLSFDQNNLHKTVAVTNSTTSDVLAWSAQVTFGNTWLQVDAPASGATPGTLGVTVDLSSVTPNVTHNGVIRVTAVVATNSPKDLAVTLLFTDAGLQVTPKQLSISQPVGGPIVTKSIAISRPGLATAWAATALSTVAAQDVIAALADGTATVGPEGVIVDGAPAAVPAWLSFTPDHGITPSTMTVSVIGTTPGTYTATIMIVADDPSVPNRVQAVDVTAIIGKGSFLPYVTRP